MRRWLSFAIVSLLAVSLVGCNSSTTTNANTETTAQETTTTTNTDTTSISYENFNLGNEIHSSKRADEIISEIKKDFTVTETSSKEKFTSNLNKTTVYEKVYSVTSKENGTEMILILQKDDNERSYFISLQILRLSMSKEQMADYVNTVMLIIKATDILSYENTFDDLFAQFGNNDFAQINTAFNSYQLKDEAGFIWFNVEPKNK